MEVLIQGYAQAKIARETRRRGARTMPQMLYVGDISRKSVTEEGRKVCADHKCDRFRRFQSMAGLR